MEVPVSVPVLRPEDLRKISDDIEMAKVRETLSRKQKEEEEHDKLRQAFMQEDIPPNVTELVNASVRRVAEQNRNELMVMSFPSEWCSDLGRAINNGDPDWPNSLQGRAKKALEFYETDLKPLGYKARAQILNYPDGMPGDVGLFLSW
jgi:hypothetical protein